MKKRKIRCHTGYAFADGVYNNEVFYILPDGWALSLATCINCGELFVIDYENPKTNNLKVKDIGNGHFCPNCSSPLNETLENYPEFFRSNNGKIGSFIPSEIYPPDNEGKIIEVWELPSS